MLTLIDRLLEFSDYIRYVAVYDHGELTSRSRPGVDQASSAESDKYEELIVNPTLLTLVSQRGKIDCGGIQFVLIRYGYFYQIIIPRTDGHISISVEPSIDPLTLIEPIYNIMNNHHSA